MHVITLDQAIRTSPHPLHPFDYRWHWPMPHKDSLYLIQLVPHTNLILNNQLILSSGDQLSPVDVWDRMTDVLLDYGIVCTPIQPLAEKVEIPKWTFES